jgi:ATP-binding cassette, subfamily B, bacterial
MRFYDASSGSVYIDDVPVASVTRHSLRSQLGVVFQESFLFNTSIRENIRIGNRSASDQDVEAAAKAAEIHDTIMTMPDRYETVVGDRGGRLSGGQRQRIAIARAIVRKPSILLLDEATSALDPATEALINATLAKLSVGRTVLSVTHRLASVVRFDSIFVFDAGRVVESGTHESLLRKGGFYARLWAKQSGFELAEDGSSASVDVERLRAIPILSDLTPSNLQRIAGVCVSNAYQRNANVFEQGDNGDKFYIIVRGRFRVIRDNLEIATLEDGDCFGEIALIKNQPRNATVRALGESLCLSLDRAHFQKLLADSPGTQRRVEELISTRLLANA